MTEMSRADAAAYAGTTGFKAPGTTPDTAPRGFGPALAGVNFGIYMALLTPVLVSMALKVQHITGSLEEATAQLGLVFGVGALFALVANPLAGRLSDRTTSRFGMRRPWILGGSIVGLGALALIGFASSIWVVLIGWCLAQASLNAVLAAANATLPDQVPTHQRGRVSGLVGITTPIAILVGSFLMNAMTSDVLRFVVPGLIALALCVMFVILLKDRRLTEKPAEKFTLLQFLGSFVFNPVKHPDFGWTWLTKFFIMFGYAGIATYLPFFLAAKFGLGEQESISVILFANLASTIGMVISSPLGGYFSDRLAKRRPFVAIAGMIMVVGLVLLAFAPTIAVVIIAQGIIGLGTGSFMSVDLALATEVLPNKEDVAKDLGVLNMANALPQSIAPAIAPAIIALGAGTAIGGYSVWYLFGAFIALLGAILVYRIKGVK